jgi:hypothetical protein
VHPGVGSSQSAVGHAPSSAESFYMSELGSVRMRSLVSADICSLGVTLRRFGFTTQYRTYSRMSQHAISDYGTCSFDFALCSDAHVLQRAMLTVTRSVKCVAQTMYTRSVKKRKDTLGVSV